MNIRTNPRDSVMNGSHEAGAIPQEPANPSVDCIEGLTPDETQTALQELRVVLNGIAGSERSAKALAHIEWMLSMNTQAPPAWSSTDLVGDQDYGDPAVLNTGGLISRSMDKEILQGVVSEYLDLIGTSSAIYEKNGDYAYGVLCSHWCRLLDSASRKSCNTDDNRTALASGKWLCHESCWRCSALAISSKAPVDMECYGGIRIYAEPIFAGEEAIGAINFGYGDPARDEEKLRDLAVSYGVEHEVIMREARAYDSRPPYIIEMAKRRLRVSARLIGSLVERKQTEDALRESEERFRSILQDVQSVAVQGYGPDGVTQYWNQASEQLYGYSAQEALGKNLLDLIIPPGMRRDVIQAMEWTARTGQPIPASELTLMRKDGSDVVVFSSHTLVHVPGRPQEMFCVDIDLSELKQAENALRESEERFRAMSENSHNAICVVDTNARLTWINNRMIDISGYTREQLLGAESFIIFLAPESIEFVISNFQLFLSGQAYEHHYQFMFIHADGGKRVIEKNMTDYVDRNGKRNLIISMLDITERKQAEEALRESGEQLALALDVGGAGIWEWNVLAETVRFDTRFHVMLGYAPGELPTTIREWTLHHHPEDARILWPKTEAYLRGEISTFESEHRIRGKSGEWRWVFTRGRIVNQAAGGTPELFIAIAMNITERKKAEEEKARLEAQLQQSQKMESVGRLAGGVAHDFNNMLGVILGHAELGIEMNPSGSLHASLVEIREAANRSAALTRQLLAFAREQTVTPQVLNINEAIEGMLKMLRRMIGEDIDLAWLPRKDIGSVWLDSSQMDQILANLCVNARDAIAGVGKITIETSNAEFDDAYFATHVGYTPGRYIRLAVSDNGCGMDQETLSHIFEPFYTTKELGKGTGLGLATVYGAVKQNHGCIDVYSELGSGTTFTIYLPRYEGAMTPPNPTITDKPAASNYETILLVEDEPALLKLTAMMLKSQGYAVLAASSIDEALHLAAQHAAKIHLLMTDVVMPMKYGPDLARDLLLLYPHMRCLFMSGYTAEAIARHGVLDEDVHFIKKPFTRKDLSTKVRKALDD